MGSHLNAEVFRNKCDVNKNMVHLLHPVHLKEFQQSRHNIFVFSLLYRCHALFRARIIIQNAHTLSYIKAPLLLRIMVRHTNIKATGCSKTTCFAKFRGTLRKNRAAIFPNGAAIFPNGASIFSNGATVWLNFLENSEP